MHTFKSRVFSVVAQISRGRVLTYKEVALLAGNPRAFRAVGNILNKNYNKNIPCHRVISVNGTLGGYNRGIKNKIRILKQEGIKFECKDGIIKVLQ